MTRLVLFLFIGFITLNTNAQMKQSGYLDLPQTRMYYEVYGEGPPVLLLHGWTQTSAFWHPFLPELSENFEVYVMDLRGHGRSGALDERFSIQSAAKDVTDMMDALGLDKVRAVGLSFGGIILLENATQNPGRFKEMILIGSVYDFNGQDADNESFDWKNLPEEFRRQLLAAHTDGESQVAKLFDPELDYQVHLSAEQLGNIRSPVLVISGDQDTIAGPGTALELFRVLPNAQLWIVPDRGHVPFDSSNVHEFTRQADHFFRD